MVTARPLGCSDFGLGNGFAIVEATCSARTVRHAWLAAIGADDQLNRHDFVVIGSAHVSLGSGRSSLGDCHSGAPVLNFLGYLFLESVRSGLGVFEFGPQRKQRLESVINAFVVVFTWGAHFFG
jgi:hypothetical protein